MKIHRIGLDRPVLTGVVFTALTLFGLIALRMLPLDLFPKLEIPAITVFTTYGGASAADVEQKVTKPIEESVGTITGVKDISSSSMENLSSVSLSFEFGSNLDEATNSIRDRIDLIRKRLPAEIGTPQIFKLDMAMMPVLVFGVTSDAGPVQENSELIRKRVADQLQRVPGVGSVSFFNEDPRQVRVEVDRDLLAAHGLPLSQVAGALMANNLTLPAGNMQLGAVDYVIRLPGEYRSLEEVEQVIVGQSPTGGLVYLKDVARVAFGYDLLRNMAKINGNPALVLLVSKQSGANTVDVSDRLLKELPKLQAKLPPHLKIEPVMDTANFVRQMIQHLWEALWVAGILVILVAFVFLRRLRSSAIIAMTIPASMIFAFAGMYAFGYTLNMISMMSMTLAVGLVVDDAIVVLESITRHLEWGKPLREAIATGTREVIGAVVASTTTSAIIFTPLLFVSGLVGIMFGQLAFVIITTLCASLAAAFFLTPLLAARLLQDRRTQEQSATRRGSPGLKERAYQSSERAMEWLEQRLYRRAIEWVLAHRAITLLVMGLAFLGSLALIPLVGMNLMPKQDSGELSVSFELPVGTRVEKTAEVATRIDAILHEQVPELTRTFMRAGEARSGQGSGAGGKQTTYSGMVMATLVPLAQRNRSSHEIGQVLRDEVRKIPGLTNLDVQTTSVMSSVMTGGQKPITVQVLGSDFAVIRDAARKVGDVLGTISGVSDITVGLADQKPELHVDVDRVRASRLGLNIATVADAVRSAFYGVTVTKYRGEAEEMDLFLTLRPEQRTAPADLGEMTLRTMTGAQVQVKSVATVNEALGPSEINRLNKQRMIAVGATYRNRPLGDIVTELERKLAAANLPPEVGIQFGGDVKQQKETSLDLLLLLGLAIVMVYLVMAAQFESLLDPLIIMFSIPFAFSGVFLALFLSRQALSLPAFLGLIMLMGIVAKNAILLVDYANLLRSRGEGLAEAVAHAGERRLRPILMTALACIGGMIPLAVSRGEGHEMWAPMGLAVIGGLVFSTLTSLVLIPTVYASVERFRRKGFEARSRTDLEDEEERTASAPVAVGSGGGQS